MKTFVYDGSFDGCLCALAAGLSDIQTPEGIQPESGRQSSFFCTEVSVATDEDVARRLLARVREDISSEALRHVIYALLAELPNLEMPLFFYLREGLIRGKEIDRWHANSSVKVVHEASRKTGAELHRFKGLLRFRELDDGTLWAPVEPDHQVLYPLARHFHSRLPAEQGIIHDLRRGLAVGWDSDGLRYIEPPCPQELDAKLADSEQKIQELWQTYFRSTTIRERANSRLQKQCMPVRYWKWLTEISL